MEGKAGFNDINIKTIDEFKKYAVDRIPSIVIEKDGQTILEKLNLQEDKKLKKQQFCFLVKILNDSILLLI